MLPIFPICHLILLPHLSYLIFINNLLSEECWKVWDKTRVHTDEIHHTNATHTIGVEAVPDHGYKWNYNNIRGINFWGFMYKDKCIISPWAVSLRLTLNQKVIKKNNPKGHTGQIWKSISILRAICKNLVTKYQTRSQNTRWETTLYDIFLISEFPSH